MRVSCCCCSVGVVPRLRGRETAEHPARQRRGESAQRRARNRSESAGGSRNLSRAQRGERRRGAHGRRRAATSFRVFSPPRSPPRAGEERVRERRQRSAHLLISHSSRRRSGRAEVDACARPRLLAGGSHQKSGDTAQPPNSSRHRLSRIRAPGSVGKVRQHPEKAFCSA